MSTKEKVESITLFSVNTDGTYSEPIKFDNVTSVTLDEHSINNNYNTHHMPTSFTAKLHLPYTKMSKKKFKKWCMSHNISRDEAELLCRLIRIFSGSLSYQEIYMIGIFTPSFESILGIIVYKAKKLIRSL